MLTFRSLLLVAQFFIVVTAEPPLLGPTITLDNGEFTGKFAGPNTHEFLGIPFAKPPVDDLRFRLPQTIPPYEGMYDATRYGPACPQQAISIPDNPAIPDVARSAAGSIADIVYKRVFSDSEDCLTINVVKPASAEPTSRLPVVVWIHGGGFEVSSSSTTDGGGIVSQSIAMGVPIIHVSMNYRLTGFGFLAGKEVKEAGVGNLGLHDQREAFRWVRKYISRFGGDPFKVTIFGESAGAVSVALHMVAFDGKTDDLFRAALMMSGGPYPVGDISRGQKYYDLLVEETGCTHAGDTLACLRTVPYQILKSAIDKTPSITSYQSINLPWLPRTDSTFLMDDPQKLVQQNKVANIPYITGNCDDDGTLFSLSSLNVTTDAGFKEWMQTITRLPDTDIDNIMQLYPADVTKGSPYDTGHLNALTPQYKRIASFQGDFALQAPRRWMVESTVPSNPNVWVYLSKRLKATPFLGSFHGSDLVNMYGGGELAEYLIRFATNLDPNPLDSIFGLKWSKYDLNSRNILTLFDGPRPVAITQDNHRREAMRYLTQVSLVYPL